MKRLIVIALGIALLAGCGILKPKTQFCDTIPADSYSIICQITERLGTTPEQIGLGLQLANLAGVDQWYTAQQADAYLADLQQGVQGLRAAGVPWSNIGIYFLGKYNMLPAKVQAAISILSEFYTIDDPDLQTMQPSEYDWNRIEYRLANLRAMLMPYLK